MPSWDAVGIGVAVRDISVRLDQFPQSDEKCQSLGTYESGGGPVPTALVTMTRLGRRTTFAGVVGEDSTGRFVLKGLEDEGVDLHWMQYRAELTTPTSVILVENGRRTILEPPRTSTGNGLPLDEALLDRLPLESCRCLLIDARSASVQLEAAKRVRAAGGLVVLDCGHPRPGVGSILAHTDIAILSHTYPKALNISNRDPAQFLEELHGNLPEDGPAIAGMTLGEDGCMLKTAAHPPQHLPGQSVRAVDTTGAGDVFHGAFVHAYLDTGSAEIAGRFANACAAGKCEGMTGRAPIPPADELWRRARSAP